MFSKNYVTYIIKTIPLSKEVTRRYSDFLDMRNKLIKICPNKFIPPLPKKERNKFSDPIICKRKYLLERFLNDVLKCSNLKNLPLVKHFLDDPIYTDKENNNLTYLNENSFSDEILKGKYSLDSKFDIKNEAIHLNNFLKETEKNYHSIKTVSKILLEKMNEVSNCLFQLGQLFNEIYEKCNSFNNKININRNRILDLIYVTLNRSFMSWGDQIQKKKILMQDYLSNFFTYENNCNLELKELTNKNKRIKIKKNETELNYEKPLIVNKKELTPQNQSLSQEGVNNNLYQNLIEIIPKELKEEKINQNKELKYLLIHEEILKTIDRKIDSYLNNFISLAESEHKTNIQINKYWSEFITIKKKLDIQKNQNRNFDMSQNSNWELNSVLSAINMKSNHEIVLKHIDSMYSKN